MIIRFSFSFLLLFLYIETLALTLPIISAPFNISHFLYPKIAEELRPQPSPFLRDVLETVSESQRWNLEDVRVSKLDVRRARYGTLQQYEFRHRFGKSELIFKLYDEVLLWKKFQKGGNFESLAGEVSSKAMLDTFRVEGPLELRVGVEDELSVLLPMNTSHAGLKRILIGQGITVEVRDAQKVSLFHRFDLRQQAKSKSIQTNRERGEFWPLRQSLCMPLLPIHISGSVAVVAYRTRNRDAYVGTAFPSQETIELLPDKCYTRQNYRKNRACPIVGISFRIALLKKLLSGFLVGKISQNVVLSSLKAKIEASSILRFQLELERNIRSNDTFWSTLAEWRTRPTVEHVWFEVVARIEADRLKPLMIKKVRPFIEVDSSAWSNLMSNISFTKFPSIFVPPEALTLDVKW